MSPMDENGLFSSCAHLKLFNVSVPQGSHRSWKVMENARSWKSHGKVMEFDRSWKKSWKMIGHGKRVMENDQVKHTQAITWDAGDISPQY